MNDKDFEKKCKEVFHIIETTAIDPDLSGEQRKQLGIKMAFEVIIRSTKTYNEAMEMIDQVKEDYKDWFESLIQNAPN